MFATCAYVCQCWSLLEPELRLFLVSNVLLISFATFALFKHTISS